MFRPFAAVLFALTSLAAAQSPAPAADPENPHEEAMRAYERLDRVDPPKPGGILFLGGMSFKNTPQVAQDFPPSLRIIARGFPGWSMEDTVKYAARMTIGYRPATVVLQAGSVDLRRGKTPEEVFAMFQRYVGTVRAALPDARVLYLSQTPSFPSWNQRGLGLQLNILVADYAKTTRSVGYVDLWTPMIAADGLPRRDLFVEGTGRQNREAERLRAKVLLPFLDPAAP